MMESATATARGGSFWIPDDDNDEDNWVTAVSADTTSDGGDIRFPVEDCTGCGGGIIGSNTLLISTMAREQCLGLMIVVVFKLFFVSTSLLLLLKVPSTVAISIAFNE